MRQGEFVTEAATSQRALDADPLQYTLQAGPCVGAVLGDQIYNPSDLARDGRWPQLGPRLSAEVGFNSCLSYQLDPNLVIEATASATARPATARPATAAPQPLTCPPRGGPSPDRRARS